jgi:hypothetical protein
LTGRVLTFLCIEQNPVCHGWPGHAYEARTVLVAKSRFRRSRDAARKPYERNAPCRSHGWASQPWHSWLDRTQGSLSGRAFDPDGVRLPRSFARRYNERTLSARYGTPAPSLSPTFAA